MGQDEFSTPSAPSDSRSEQPAQPTAAPQPAQQPAQPAANEAAPQPVQPYPGYFNVSDSSDYYASAGVPASGQAAGGGKAIGALVCGILAIVFSWLPLIGIILGIVAIVLAVKSAKHAGKDGKATGGKVCGIVGIVLSVLAFIAWLALGAFVTAVLQQAPSNTYDSFYGYDFGYDAPAPDYDGQYDLMGDLSADEEAIAQLAQAELDKLAAADEATVGALAARIDEGFGDMAGYTFSELGGDPEELVRWMLSDFSYEMGSVFVDGSEGTAYADVSQRDVFSLMMALDSKMSDFAYSEEATAMTEDEIMARVVELCEQAMEETSDMTTYYAAFDFEKSGDSWVLDQDSWEDELGYMFLM